MSCPVLLAESKTLSVSNDQFTDYHSIQDAINDADDGDTIEIHPGHYYEQISTLGKAVHLKGIVHQNQRPVLLGRLALDSWSDMPVLPILRINSGEDSSTVVSDLVFTRGYYAYGAALYIYQSSPSIRDCYFFDNWGGWGGGAVHCRYSESHFLRCIFSENYCGSFGGAMYLVRSPVFLEACFFDDNYVSGFGGGLYVNHLGGAAMRPALMGCFFLENGAQNTWTSRHIRGGWHDLGWNAFADDVLDSDDDGVPDDFEEQLESDLVEEGFPEPQEIDAASIMNLILETGALGLYTPGDLDMNDELDAVDFEMMLKGMLD